ncbi:hypothetical protein N7471_008260 [Penicillium samsonianum]|uniref:uncharacterized protein n=1 Tax=Penicillium samsonianum TaxID=1882272 RepID=UPI00254970AB|nr:uncharacterized protein N7471_008260 [Penicillium samsonianum]KAJ6133045.1 hypothetical protein N7471_008260 [Penicillium samsonianum]
MKRQKDEKDTGSTRVDQPNWNNETEKKNDVKRQKDPKGEATTRWPPYHSDSFTRSGTTVYIKPVCNHSLRSCRTEIIEL